MLHAATFATPLGDMFALASAQGLCLLAFTDQAHLARAQAQVQQARGPVHSGGHGVLAQVDQQLHAYFAGRLRHFDVPLDGVGTAFQQRVWQALQRIPWGQTCSYAQQAAYLGQPRAVRAVAQAHGQNKIAILVPCHRVIGSQGQLTGYAGGLARKRYLLALEAAQTPTPVRKADTEAPDSLDTI